MKTATISVVVMMIFGVMPAGVAAQSGGPGAERFVLTGLVVWGGNEGVAWLQEPDLTRNQIVALRIGERVGPWKLTGFLDNGVELDGPAGKVIVPLQNVGAGGPAVATGTPAAPAAAAAPTARAVPRDDASRVAAPAAPVSPVPGFVWEGSRPGPNANAGALGEALNRARAERAQRQTGNAQEQPQAGSAGSQAAHGPSTSGVTSSGGARGGESGGASKVIQLPPGGGKQGIRELFGLR